MRFHVLALPHAQTTMAFSSCAFTEKVRKFCKMMKGLGHTVFLYAGDENEAPCDELITCITETERKEYLGDVHYTQAPFDASLPQWTTFNARAAAGILDRIEQKDFICVIGGNCNKPVADAFPNHMTVEFGIGYGGTFAKYRVWESYAWMHTCYGAANGNPNAVDGQWFDAVIPSYFEPELFPFQAEKDDYYLFIGRLTERKGFQIAADVCKALGKKLIIAGAGTPPDYGEHVGVVGPEDRGRLMSGARAVFVPTIYIEPFGSVVCEAQLCGTPTITTDWGAFVETNVHGLTGYRCRTFAEFKQAALDVDKLDNAAIRQHALERYSLDAVAPMYDTYFRRLQTLWADGWYAT